MVRSLSPNERFQLKLIEQTPSEERCPYLRSDSDGPYCGRNLQENTHISNSRRMVCDCASLQLWCLDKERALKCIFYQGEPFIE